MNEGEYFHKNIAGFDVIKGKDGFKMHKAHLRSLVNKLVDEHLGDVLEILELIADNNGKFEEDQLNVNKYVLEGLYVHNFLKEKSEKLYLTEKGKRLWYKLPINA